MKRELSRTGRPATLTLSGTPRPRTTEPAPGKAIHGVPSRHATLLTMPGEVSFCTVYDGGRATKPSPFIVQATSPRLPRLSAGSRSRAVMAGAQAESAMLTASVVIAPRETRSKR